MVVTLGEAILLLDALGYEDVKVSKLKEIFLKQETPTETPQEEPLPELPELEEPPKPPEQEVFKTYAEAKKKAKKGQKPIKDEALGGYVLM